MLCRSGLRSVPAAQRAQALGFEAYNILEGFEGDPDSDAHRVISAAGASMPCFGGRTDASVATIHPVDGLL